MTAPTAPVEPMAWRCFHCDEVFTDRDAALAHFGPSCTETPVCQIPALAEMLRDMQRELSDMRSDDLSQSAKEYHSLGARHYVREREAEQSGYDKGLADGRAEHAALIATSAPQPAPGGGRDWPEDASGENGNYQCRCCKCGNTFVGHKRRVVCKLCSTAPGGVREANLLADLLAYLDYQQSLPCSVCGADCAGANPPVPYCPTRDCLDLHKRLSAYQAASARTALTGEPDETGRVYEAGDAIIPDSIFRG